LKKERIDNMGFGDLRLIQRPEDFCYGIDAVILADFACRDGDKSGAEEGIVHVADLGAGNGAVSLILTHKLPQAKLLAVEVQGDAAGLAERNVKLNGLSERIEVFHGDILDLPQEMRGSMDMVVANPPYVRQGGGIINKHSSKAIARLESTAGLSDFLRVAKDILRDKGDFYMVHRPSRLVDILAEGRSMGMEAKTLLPVAPGPKKAANLILVHFVKNGGQQLTYLPELRVYGEDGGYTKEIEKIYERI
jgi:tRNA1Val (adenine37-N6)-methyltransferase